MSAQRPNIKTFSSHDTRKDHHYKRATASSEVNSFFIIELSLLVMTCTENRLDTLY